MIRSKNKEWLNCECAFCGRLFHDKPSHMAKCKNHYCSKKCHYAAKKQYMRGNGNHQYGLVGNKNASWKSDKRITNYGYRKIRSLNHPFRDSSGFVLEHRLIAEKYLLNDENSIEVDGVKYLSDEYEVHHINFDKLDNRIENLLVLSKSEHCRLHNYLKPRRRDDMTGKFVSDKLKIKIMRLSNSAIIPQKGTIGSAGFDLFVDSDDDVEIRPHETKMLQSNIAFAIPDGWFGAVFARSGLSTKKGIRPSTCVSVIDSDYRGGVGVPLHNDSNNTYIVKPHERVAQIVFMESPHFELECVDELNDTSRGQNGFGSTGR